MYTKTVQYTLTRGVSASTLAPPPLLSGRPRSINNKPSCTRWGLLCFCFFVLYYRVLQLIRPRTRSVNLPNHPRFRAVVRARTMKTRARVCDACTASVVFFRCPQLNTINTSFMRTRQRTRAVTSLFIQCTRHRCRRRRYRRRRRCD